MQPLQRTAQNSQKAEAAQLSPRVCRVATHGGDWRPKPADTKTDTGEDARATLSKV